VINFASKKTINWLSKQINQFGIKKKQEDESIFSG